MRILIAEDDEALAKFVSQGLTAERYTVDVCSDGEQARTAANEQEYDLIVLDLNLPRLDGVSILRQLRRQKPTLPVLVLTQRTKVEDRVQCLDTGADDYLPKPFSFSELSARIRALLRRSHLPSESVLAVEDLKLDRVEHRVERAGRRVELTTKEFALLEYLMRNAGRKVTRAMIIEHVWNLTFDTTTNVVDVYINYQTLGTTGAGDPIQVGAGTEVGSMPSLFTQGSISSTGVPTDVAIQGSGFFAVQDSSGAIAYTRAGDFSTDASNFLITSNGQQVLGYPAANGVVNTGNGIVPLQLGAGTISPPAATGNVQLTVNLNAAASVGDTFSTPVTIYDSLGASHTLTATFTNTAANNWSYSLSIPSGDLSPTTSGGTSTPQSGVLATGTLTFNGNGVLVGDTAATGGTVSGSLSDVTGIPINGLADGASNQTFNWNVLSGTTPVVSQVAGTSSASGAGQDGSSSGSLVNFTIGSDGTITGSFSNGKTQALGELALANFANVNGLQLNGGTDYTPTLASGPAVVGVPGSGGLGTISGGALELSNVDIATEFANLIVAQRGFEADAKAVTTFDQITQDTIALKQ
ncbi:MAG: flagellar hook-basal body complex protein [Candidatus Sulfotelmatobacter sp.]